MIKVQKINRDFGAVRRPSSGNGRGSIEYALIVGIVCTVIIGALEVGRGMAEGTFSSLDNAVAMHDVPNDKSP